MKYNANHWSQKAKDSEFEAASKAADKQFETLSRKKSFVKSEAYKQAAAELKQKNNYRFFGDEAKASEHLANAKKIMDNYVNKR